VRTRYQPAAARHHVIGSTELATANSARRSGASRSSGSLPRPVLPPISNVVPAKAGPRSKPSAASTATSRVKSSRPTPNGRRLTVGASVLFVETRRATGPCAPPRLQPRSILADAAGDSYWSLGGVDPFSQTGDTNGICPRTAVLARHRQLPTTAAGYRALLRWLRSFGPLSAVGVEGTGSYGSALAGVLADAGLEVALLQVRMGPVAGW
jgi:hypothetical protein